MRPLRYSINITLDGCCDHRAVVPNEDVHRHAENNLNEVDALLFGRVTYLMMEDGWRHPVPPGTRPEWMEPFARTINQAKKYVVTSTLQKVDWNTEIVRGDVFEAVRELKQQPGKGLLVGGVQLPLALAQHDLIDEYDILVQPKFAGHGPTLLAGLEKHVDLELINRIEYSDGAVALRLAPKSRQ